MRATASKIVGAANDDSDESDSDSEGMDDAAMFRIDKLLAEAFKSRQQDLMRKKNLKRATRDFKFRVISLFQLYAKAQPGSAYLPGSVVTLLDAMRDTLGKQDPQSTQLAERIASLISKHIAHARDLPRLLMRKRRPIQSKRSSCQSSSARIEVRATVRCSTKRRLPRRRFVARFSSSRSSRTRRQNRRSGL